MANEQRPVECYVHVEELIPRVNVQYMLQLADNLEQLEPVESKTAFKDLKRAMAWMEKYISPTSEFWEWTNDTFDIDANTTLTVDLLGFGWAVAVSSRKPVGENDISSEEKRLAGILDKLTRHIPVRAMLRVKSTSWTKANLREVAQMLKLNGITCEPSRQSLVFKGDSLRIDVEPEERLECTCVSREHARRIEHILSLIKEYANRKYEGAGWCAYQRRRLTVVHKIGTERASQKDLRFLRHPEYGMDGEILASQIGGPDNFLARFYFVRAKYHLGNIHPRALIAVNNRTGALREFSTYVYYLWNFHYSRIWLYLLFEDIYAYVDRLRGSEPYSERKIRDYWESLLKAEEIVTEMDMHDRIERGLFQSYKPPHDRFREEEIAYLEPAPIRPIHWLRHVLIEATTTQLYEDPLKRALSILRELDESMKKTLDLFVGTVDVRIQKTLHILQFSFIVAAVATVVQLLNLGQTVIEILKHFGIWIPLIDPIPVSLANLLLVISISGVVLSLLRTTKVRNWIEDLIR